MKRDGNPPALASWLLARLADSYRRDALLGDLAEEYRQGRSRGWYWWQVLGAAAASLSHWPPSTRFVLGAFRFLMIAGMLIGASFHLAWPLFILVLDPSLYLLHRWSRGRRRITGRGDL